MVLVINPGSGPVDNATRELAEDNIKHFITDTGKEAEYVSLPERDYGDGRFAFLIWYGNRCHEIQMPGLSLDKVRYVNGLDPWQFPRLYVDDSSWLWEFALGCVFQEDED